MYSSATNRRNSTAEESLPKWINWCRLCAKKDTKNNINFLYLNKEEEHSEYGVKELSIQEALAKYFWVEVSLEDSLPKMLCPDCLSLLSFLIKFNECVGRVQQLYHYLNDFHNITTNYSCDLNSISLNNGATEQARNQSHLNYASSEENVDTECTFLETLENTQSSVGDRVETPDPEDYIEEYDTNDGEREEVASENSNDFCQEDDENFAYSNEEENDDSFSPEEEEKVEVSSTSKPGGRAISFINDMKIDITCKKCGENFAEILTYLDHLQQIHNQSKNSKHWSCPLCDNRSYSMSQSLKRHLINAHVQTIKCPKCGKCYKSNAEMEEHTRNKHTIRTKHTVKEKLFICEVCGLALMNSTNLKRHMVRHTDVAPFECKICKHKSKSKERLKKHMAIHSSKRYVCNICGIHLKSKDTYKGHMLVHSDKRKYKCDYCGKTFKLNKHLSRHLLIHIGLRPYLCDICELTFTTAYNCTLHVKKTHPNEYAERKALGNKIITNNMPKLETLKAITNNLINKKNKPRT